MEGELSVAEAARRTGHSESTIRRLIKAGALEQVLGRSPARLTAASVEVERARVLQRLGATEPSASTKPYDERLEVLQRRVLELSGALADLTSAHSALLDTFRRLSSDSVPND